MTTGEPKTAVPARTMLRATALAAAAIVVMALAGPVFVSPATAAPQPTGSMCDHSWSGLASYNPLASIRAGVFGEPGRPPTQVGVNGDVNWNADPYHDLTWRVWLTSLKWLGPLLDSHRINNNDDDLALANAYAHDYVHDKPLNAKTPYTPVLQAAGHRLMFFTCLYEASPSPWLADAMNGTVEFIKANWAGEFNHGQDQDLSLIAAGCTLGRQDWVDLATRGLARILAVSIDAQGATNEQSTGYAFYSYRRWQTTATTLATCGEPPLPDLASKLKRARIFVTSATRPDGKLVPIGDTYPGTAGLTYSAGLPLSQAWSIGGYAFGRSSWNVNTDPSFYSLRFGPGRAVHGGPDHGSVTLYAHGAPIVTEPGSIGYIDKRTDWFRFAPEAHNVLLVGNGGCSISKTAPLVAKKQRWTYDTYVVKTPSCNATTATRGVAYTRATGTTVVTDSTSAAAPLQSFQQLWHLTPGTVVSSGWIDRHRTLRISLRMPNGSRATFHVTSPKHTSFSFGVVTGRTSPYQGWVSGGVHTPVAAPVLVISQRAHAASLRTTMETK